KMYFKDGRIKILVALAKGKAMHDKRRAIADRDNKRDLQRIMSRKLP
ncbi:MAG: SsrA-binding protein, partial [Phycisphaerales bacterium]|nr:SsrA-binding protein [Phycisphaerales bacterium]